MGLDGKTKGRWWPWGWVGEPEGVAKPVLKPGPGDAELSSIRIIEVERTVTYRGLVTVLAETDNEAFSLWRNAQEGKGIDSSILCWHVVGDDARIVHSDSPALGEGGLVSYLEGDVT